MPQLVCPASVAEHARHVPIRCQLVSGHPGDHNGTDDGGSMWWASGFLPYRFLETVGMPGKPMLLRCWSKGVFMNSGMSNCSLHENHVGEHFDAGRCMYWDHSLTPIPLCSHRGNGYHRCTRRLKHAGLHAYMHEPTVFWDDHRRKYPPGMLLMCQDRRTDGLLCELPHRHKGDHKNSSLGGGWANGAPAYQMDVQPETRAARTREQRKGRRR